MSSPRRFPLAPIILLTLARVTQASDAITIKVGGSFEVEAVKNVAYYDGKDADPNKHKLDLYLPKGHKNFPVLFFIHGGGWTIGDRWQYGLVGQIFAKNGIGTAVISYRLSNPAFPGRLFAL